jgi:hypothetical protein
VIAVLAGVVRALMILFLMRLVFRVIAGSLLRVTAPTPSPPAPSTGGDLVRDAVCNTFLPRGSAREALIAGRTAWFCSAACEAKARAEAFR